MDKKLLNDLKKEYDKKRQKAIEMAENKKISLYENNPKLQEIESSLSALSIKTAKSILLNSTSSTAIDTLKEDINKLNRQKLDIFHSLGMNETDFEPDFECKICNDTGYIEQNGLNTMCNCLKQKIFNAEYNKSNLGNLEKENFSSFNLNLYSDEINFDKYKSKVSPRDNIIRIKSISEKFIQNFDSPDEKNLIFMGNSGLGKTFLSNCIANELLKNGKTVLYQTAPVMLEEIINYRFDKPNCNKDIMDNLLNVDLLIIDDLGTENVNSMKFTELFNVLNSRLLNQNHKITKTIISTNLTLQNIYSIYDERIASRIVGYYTVCKFFGDDIRFKSKR